MGTMKLCTLKTECVHCDMFNVFRTCRCQERCGTVETPHRVDARKHMRADLSNGRVMPIEHAKMTSKSHLSDDMLDVSDETGPDELYTEADALDVGHDLLNIFMNEIDSDSDKPDHHVDGHAVDNTIKSDEIEGMEVLSSWSGLSGAAMSKKWSQLSISLGPLM